jgi:hypothetical protein
MRLNFEKPSSEFDAKKQQFVDHAALRFALSCGKVKQTNQNEEECQCAR